MKTVLRCSWSLELLETILDLFLVARLRALMEMCILIPGSSSKLHQNWGTKVRFFVLEFYFVRTFFMQNLWLTRMAFEIFTRMFFQQ